MDLHAMPMSRFGSLQSLTPGGGLGGIPRGGAAILNFDNASILSFDLSRPNLLTGSLVNLSATQAQSSLMRGSDAKSAYEVYVTLLLHSAYFLNQTMDRAESGAERSPPLRLDRADPLELLTMTLNSPTGSCLAFRVHTSRK
jgi:hypothetical protein